MKKDTEFAEVYKMCQEFGFSPDITAQTCWNEGYQLGRRRWHWGPPWFVSLRGWFNTQLGRIGIKPL